MYILSLTYLMIEITYCAFETFLVNKYTITISLSSLIYTNRNINKQYFSNQKYTKKN